MKRLPFIVLLIFTVSCASGDPEPVKTTSEQSTQKEPEILTSATYEKLVGIWQITEERSHPEQKGKVPGMMHKGVLFGFHENGKFATTSMGLEQMKETFGDLGVKVIVDKGMIVSEEPNDIFKMQWKEGLAIYLLNEDELVLKHDGPGSNKDTFYYFKRVK